jgi:hypothetical protein
MTNIIVVEKNGTLRSLIVKKITDEELYKKAGFKTPTHFKMHTSWKITVNEKPYHICVYGKNTGKAMQENKYEFPPPIDNVLFFGNVLILNKNENEWKDLTVDEWESIYEYLYGGFEDLGEEDTEESEEDDSELVGLPVTKNGYAKDGFVVEDSTDDVYEDENDTDSSEDDKPAKKTKRSTSRIPSSSIKLKKIPVSKQIHAIRESVKTEIEPEDVNDCTSELSEEPYV